MIWCIPTWCGDYRLEQVGDACLFTIESPTYKEVPVINALMAHANEKGWTESTLVLPAGVSKLAVSLKLNVGIQEAARYLVTQSLGTKETWSAVRSESGKVSLEEGVPEVLAATTKAVATVRQPQRGCPAPEAATRRAAEVLQLFSTQSQWSAFQRDGCMPVTGNYTGQRYFLFHRNEAHNRGMGHCLVNSQGREICVWDATVPAEEEVLGIKLAVEHREHWMLSPYSDYQQRG